MNKVYFQIAVYYSTRHLLLITRACVHVAVLNTILYFYFIGRVNQLL